MNFYDFTVKNQDGSEKHLSDYKGKVVLVVNTATACGFTPQYEPLQELYDAYHEKGLEILDFPCNQFGSQAPGSNEEIHTFCTGRFGITFLQFAKIDVNGENAAPLYKWLTSTKNSTTFGKWNPKRLLLSLLSRKSHSKTPSHNPITWNFTKFLIGREGEILARFEPTFPMDKVKSEVEKYFS